MNGYITLPLTPKINLDIYCEYLEYPKHFGLNLVFVSYNGTDITELVRALGQFPLLAELSLQHLHCIPLELPKSPAKQSH